MTPTTIPSVFPVTSSITKSEPTPKARDPAIFCLTSSGTVSGTRNFFACREALAGCRGAALTRMFGVPTVWREYKHVSCPDSAAVFLFVEPTVGHRANVAKWRQRRHFAAFALSCIGVKHGDFLFRFFCRNAGNFLPFCAPAATTAVQNSGERTANYFAIFVAQLRHAFDKLAAQNTHEVRTYTNFTSFRLSCDLRCSKNRETAGIFGTGIFGTGCAIVIPSHATLSQLPSGQVCTPTPC